MLAKRTRPVAKNSSKSRPMPNIPDITTIRLPPFLAFKDQDGPKSPTSPLEVKSPSNSVKSPRGWQKKASEGIGLGIVAAMSNNSKTHDAILSSKSCISAILAVPIKNHPVSQPIPIASAKASPKFKDTNLEDELSESYTCVISHHGPNSIRMHEYFHDKSGEQETENQWRDTGVFIASPPKYQGTTFQTDDFLKHCYLCGKRLHNQDIYMYRGDKAFCSVECRYQQIMSDEYKEKCWSKTRKPCDYSASPCSAPRLFSAGVAAA